MNTIGTLEDRPNILTTSLDVVLTYVLKYSENHVVSGAVERLYTDVKEAYQRDYGIERVHVEMLHFDRIRNGHLLLIWGQVPNEPRIVTAAYYLFRYTDEGPFTQLSCVKAIGATS
jgi:hypothetical protein